MKFFLNVLLLPFVHCCDSPKASSTEHVVQVQLHNSPTTTTFLNPLDLKSKRQEQKELLPYGFIINTNEVVPKMLIMKNHMLSIPKSAKALLVTLPKSQQEEFCQDIQITLFPDLPLPEFQKETLTDYHVPIYLQYAETAAQVQRGQKVKPCQHPEKEDELSDSQSPTGASSSENGESLLPNCSLFAETSVQVDHIRKQRSSSRIEMEEDYSPETPNPPTTYYSKKELKATSWNTVRMLFNEVGRPRWPFLALGKISAMNCCKVQSMQPLTQTTSKILDPKYFSIPYGKDDDYTFIKIQKKIIYLTKELKGSKSNKNPHIVIGLDVVRKELDGSIIFPEKLIVNFRYATKEELENFPKIKANHCNIYFHFRVLEISSNNVFQSLKKEEDRKRIPKLRRRSCIGTSPWPKYPTYKIFPSI